ncbi:MAG: hypothetical protein JWN07_1241 [Hyphomicrobiales bacterium]|nr:hypothetical protein [Hyphomicrobiales bacterium]
MSEPAAKMRYYGEPNNAFDVEEIERRMRQSIEQPQAPRDSDPLAELARLVGQTNNDAFSRIFEVQGGPTTPPPARGVPPRLIEPPQIPAPSRDNLYAAVYDQHPETRREDPGQYAQPGYPQEQGHQAYEPAAHDDQQAYAAADPYAHQEHAADAYTQQDGSWQGQTYQQDGYQQEGYPQDGYYQEAQQYAEQPRRTGRARLLIGAALLVVAGGSAGAYMLRTPAGVGKDAPTIMASSGPTKVQPAEQPSDGPKPSISILERNGPAGSSQSKLVQNEEQPVDVGATARATGSRPARSPDAGSAVTLAPPAPPPVPNSIFAEPKRVKAIAVRPDGSIIDHSPAPSQRAEAPVAAPTTPPASAAGKPTDMASLLASTTPGSGQKTATRTAETPKPPVRPAAVVTAPTTTASIPASAGGAFSVQLAGTTSVEEAKDAVDRLTRKFTSELGSHRPSVVKAEVGSKTVYRVRVKGLSSDDANTLCARLKSGGGSCFVARD